MQNAFVFASGCESIDLLTHLNKKESQEKTDEDKNRRKEIYFF